MKQHAIEFVINEREKIQIPLPYELDNIGFDDVVKVIYNNSDGVSVVMYGPDFISIFLSLFKRFLEDIVKNDIDFDIYKPITENIGYFANEAYRNRNGSWRGYNLLLQSWDDGDVQTWWYKKGDRIILELTPFLETWDKRGAISQEQYEEFMKSYKTLVVTELNMEMVREWLKHVDELLDVIKANDERLRGRSH